MKAIVLAGGHATRLWPLTRERAKPLLPLAGQPIVQYTMDALADIPAVDEILVSTNAKFADDFRRFVADAGYDARVVVEDHRSEAEKVGTLGAIMQVIEEEGADDYLVVGGDNYPSFDLSAFADAARERDAVTIACHRVGSRDAARQFGVLDTDGDDRIVGFAEKPEEPSSRLVSTAFYYFPERQLDLFDRYRDAFAGDGGDHLDEPGRLLEWGHDRVEMYAYPFEGGWHDIGTPGSYLAAQAAVGDGRRVDGAVTDCDLGEDVWVMDGATVERSALERCIVFPGADISDAELRGCIVDEEATVEGLVLEDAVIGAFSTVR